MNRRRSLYAQPEIFGGQQCTTGAFARANDGEEERAGWWPTWPSWQPDGRTTTPRTRHRPPTAEAVAYLDEHLGTRRATAGVSTLPAGGGWRAGSTLRRPRGGAPRC